MNKRELEDKLIINYGGSLIKARPANGLDNIYESETTIKVILEGNLSHHPTTVKISDIVEINGKEV